MSEKVLHEVVRGWYGRDGTRYRRVIYEVDGAYKPVVQKGVDGRYVDLPRDDEFQ